MAKMSDHLSAWPAPQLSPRCNDHICYRTARCIAHVPLPPPLHRQNKCTAPTTATRHLQPTLTSPSLLPHNPLKSTHTATTPPLPKPWLTYLSVDFIDRGGVHGQELGHLVEAVLLVHRDDAVAAGVGGEGLLVQVLRLLRDHDVRDLGEMAVGKQQA